MRQQIKNPSRKEEQEISQSPFPKFPSTFATQTLSIKYYHLSRTMMPAYGVIFSLILLLFLATVITTKTEASLGHVNGSAVVATEEPPLLPLVEEGKMEMMMMNESRRKLGSFQICALCTCCGGAKGVCMPSPCCYAINCNIPNRPFGFCSFTPKTCNCFGCHL